MADTAPGLLRAWLARYDANDEAAAHGRPFMWDADGNVTATSHNFDNVVPPMDVDEAEAVRTLLDGRDKDAPAGEPATDHAYLSTACQHVLHGACRFFCKYCPAPCECDCHDGTDGPYPGYDADSEDWLRQELRDRIMAAGIGSGPRRAELLVDIVTSVVAGIAKAAE